MTIHGKQQTVKGTVLFFLADTIGAHEIGGFKLGLSRSFRKYWHCLASQQTMSKKVGNIHVAVSIITFKMFLSLRDTNSLHDLKKVMTITVLYFKVHCRMRIQQCMV